MSNRTPERENLSNQLGAALTLPFSLLDLQTVPIVGGKCASLGEMLRMGKSAGVRVPDGFAVTVHGYRRFLTVNNLDEKIDALVANIDHQNLASLRAGGAAIRSLFLESPFPDDLRDDILSRFRDLAGAERQHEVAVRSSATLEDTDEASFAGQQQTILNVRGDSNLLIAVRECFSSLYTDRAIGYRCSRGYGSRVDDVVLAVGVQRMVRSDLAASGVAFSLDPDSGNRDTVVVNGAYGLGELVVGGVVVPDEFVFFKRPLDQNRHAPGALPTATLIRKKLGTKVEKMVYSTEPGETVRKVNVLSRDRQSFCITDEQAEELARAVLALEKHYGKPVDVEWAIDGRDHQLYIVQARPETVHGGASGGSGNDGAVSLVEYRLAEGREEIARGIAVGDGVGAGAPRIMSSIDDDDEVARFRDGDVLVTDMTDPDWEPIMRRASAIVTNRGGRTCHAAIVAREMGLPAVVGCGDATERLMSLDDDEGKPQEVTVSCAEGEAGLVYLGRVPFEKLETRLDGQTVARLPVPLMLNVASPEAAAQWRGLPAQGVGLARLEFVINNTIAVHPLALLRRQSLRAKDPALVRQIDERLRSAGVHPEHDDAAGEKFFVQQLAFGVAGIAAAFFPRRVIVRTSDFKSNEYRNLLGGEHFEPEEENPMIGWRGASRYASDAYAEAFALECRALKKVRDEMGLTNVTVMLPFVRTAEELLAVQQRMAEHGLVRGENGLEIYMMAEVPSNFVAAETFAPHIDGFSIGSNDLTQLTLGLDRDSALVSHLYNERNVAVKAMIRILLAKAKHAGVKVGICGQGPSDFPDFAQFLVEEGITTVSVTPDAFAKTVGVLTATTGAPASA